MNDNATEFGALRSIALNESYLLAVDERK